MESAPRLLSSLFQLCATCPIFFLFSVFPVYLIGCLLCSHIWYWTSPIAREQFLALACLANMRGRLLEFLHLFLPLKCDANLQCAINFEFSNSRASEFIIWNISNWSNVRWGVYFTLFACLTADRIRKCTRKYQFYPSLFKPEPTNFPTNTMSKVGKTQAENWSFSENQKENV